MRKSELSAQSSRWHSESNFASLSPSLLVRAPGDYPPSGKKTACVSLKLFSHTLSPFSCATLSLFFHLFYTYSLISRLPSPTGALFSNPSLYSMFPFNSTGRSFGAARFFAIALLPLHFSGWRSSFFLSLSFRCLAPARLDPLVFLPLFVYAASPTMASIRVQRGSSIAGARQQRKPKYNE